MPLDEIPQSQPINRAVTTVDQPAVYKAVRAVGIVHPTYDPKRPEGNPFTNRLEVLGTAFWLKDYRILITCNHVVQNLLNGPLEITGLLMVGHLGNYSRAVIAALDIAHDLAALKIVEQPNEFIDFEARSGLVLIEEYPQVGETVGYAGFPMGLQLLDKIQSPTYAEGVVAVQLRESDFRKDIQITGAVTGGFSGSPVVLKSHPDKVIGVLASGPNNPNIFMAVSWEHIKALAELAVS